MRLGYAIHQSAGGRGQRLRLCAVAILVGGICACTAEPDTERSADAHRLPLIPLPLMVERDEGKGFEIQPSTQIVFDDGDTEAAQIARQLADLIGNSDETRPEVVAAAEAADSSSIRFTRLGADATLPVGSYELTVGPVGVVVAAADAEGLFYGMQTLRQLLPPAIEYTAAYPTPLVAPAVRVVDRPRFEWRGAMLDVSRHFLPAVDVKRFIDLMVLYKLNVLHLHLSDDQGWRIEIPGRPNLTEIGGQTEVGGGPGGFYRTADYQALVEYAADRFVTIVPEIDMPGHTNAALASYPELNCDGQAPELYTGTDVGFSSLCTERESTYAFVDDVVREIARMTPGPYFHMGGDEVENLDEQQYGAFVARVEGIIQAHGKRMVGWDEVALASVGEGSLVQLWRPLWGATQEQSEDSARAAAAEALRDGVSRAIQSGARVILSPADLIYLDMKYDSATVLGLRWAGMPNVRGAYDWKISEVFNGIPEAAIAGVEAPLWSETLGTLNDVEYLAFPRLAGVAEIGWSEASSRSWEDYRLRLGAQSLRWSALGINYRRSPLVDWR